MRRVFKTRAFRRWVAKTALSDAALRKAVEEIVAGLIDADLGGGVVKKRIALPGRGKRGGARTVVATNFGDRWFFLYGFAKNEQDNISTDDLKRLRHNARYYLQCSGGELDQIVAARELEEIAHVDKA